ncbi:hypothetical protein LEQ06_05525 [Paraclostridium sp. AKS46]|nr:hypothetical protein [Paraclostridium bifermentans]MCU9807673.1 hypothetical protein [Paraclostridium sp. AKS46]
MYSIPLGIGILNGLFALICYRYMLVDNLLGSLSILKFPLIYTGSIFTIVYTIFYSITIRACERSALKSRIN